MNAALTDIYQRNWSLLVRYLRRYTGGDPETAADLAQNAFIRALGLPATVHDRLVSSEAKKQEGFLLTLARWEGLDYCRRKQRQLRWAHVYSLDDEIGQVVAETLADGAPSPERILVAKERWHSVNGTIDAESGTPRQAEMFRLWIAGASPSELAVRFGLSPRVVIRSVTRLRDRICKSVGRTI